MGQFILPITDEIGLVYPHLAMAEEIFQVVDSDREHIGQFLDFVENVKTVTDELDFLKMKLAGVAAGTDLLCFLYKKETIIGSLDLHFMDKTHQKAEIGYWLHSGYTQQGIMKKAVNRLCEYAYQTLALNKLTIVADTKNKASQGVALACGFRFVGTKKQDVLLYGEFRDMNVYELVKEDWQTHLVSEI